MPVAVLRSAADLRGGEWFRLHPLTPVLQGGVVLLGLAGAGLAALWETVILRSILVFAGVEEDDELSGIALLIADSLVLVFLGALAVVGVSALVFWFQWRVHVVRMDDDVLEVKKGVIAKSSRRARRDRINTIGVRRPLIPRLLGLAKLDIQAAGSDANVVLAYLPYSVATAVRREILQTPKAADDESEPDPQVVTRELEVSLFRYLASLVVSVETIFFGVGFVGTIIAALTAEELAAWLGPIAVVFGYVVYLADRFFRVGNFVVDSIEGDVRVSLGLLSTSVETIPPARIHALQISQPWPWKLLGWWRVDANLASSPGSANKKTPAHTLLLPVATRREMMRMVELCLPSLREGTSMAQVMTLLHSPHSHWVARGLDERSLVRASPLARYRIPLSAGVTGSAVIASVVALRCGRWVSKLALVPVPRIQSSSVSQGPWHRTLGLSSFALESVEGPVSTRVLGLSSEDARGWWDTVQALIVSAVDDSTPKRRGRRAKA